MSAMDVRGKPVCIKNGEVMQEEKIPGIEQLALGVSCKEPDLDVCILRTLSQDKEISGIKLGCCNCENEKSSGDVAVGGLKGPPHVSDETKIIGSFFEDMKLDFLSNTEPGALKVCNNEGKAVAFKIQYEEINVQDEKVDNSAMNSICLLCSGNDTICSDTGDVGDWHYSYPKRCHNGFSQVKLRVQDLQGPTKDDTGVNDAKMLCRDDATWARTEPRFKGLGDSSDTFECGSNQNKDALCVCGLQTLVQKRSYGEDFAGLLGAKFLCCKC